MSDKSDALRRWARGMLPVEAAVELLIRSFGGRFAQTGNPWIEIEADGTCWVEWSTVPDCVGALSGGERRVLLMAASLGGGIPVDLSEVSGMDQLRQDLLLSAIAHAGGSSRLHPWPEMAKTPVV